MKQKALVLWSGGKDCNLAMQLAKEAGYEVSALVTFHAPLTEFRAHPKVWMELQSRSLGIPHLFVEINEPFVHQYEVQLRKLKDQLGVTVVVSGDISEVHGNTNWISDRAKVAGLEVFLPLWKKEREEVMDLLLRSGFEVVLTLVKKPWLDERFVGERMTGKLLETFRDLGKQNGLDLCGEQGEYHTMVLNGPGYRFPITLESYSLERFEEMIHLSCPKLSFSPVE
jgi:uncharacterized protein (TIGR00290 family)